MKKFIYFLLTILAFTTKAQNKPVSEDSLIKKWELATVNIEASSPLFMEPLVRSEFQKSLDKSNLNDKEKEQKWVGFTTGKYKTTISGTAIFLKYENIDFLITARHVLEDPYSTKAGMPLIQLFFPENYNIINNTSFIPSFLYLKPFDSTLHIGNFIFSSPETDIAIVALDAYDYDTSLCNIPKILKDRGQVPIDIDAIDSSKHLKKGDLTYTIGFPDLSIKGKKISIDTFALFQSNIVTMPVVSVGKLLELNNTSPYLISDVFVYHGSSGGPLIHNNKLIGIVHGPNLETRKADGTQLKNYYFLNGNQFARAKYIIPLLRELLWQIKYNKSHDVQL